MSNHDRTFEKKTGPFDHQCPQQYDFSLPNVYVIVVRFGERLWDIDFCFVENFLEISVFLYVICVQIRVVEVS
jgi:hypothetical protein